MTLLVSYITMASSKVPRDQPGNVNECEGYTNVSQDNDWLTIHLFVEMTGLHSNLATWHLTSDFIKPFNKCIP